MLLILAIACDRFTPWIVENPGDLEEERIAVSPADLAFGDVSVNLQGSATLPITLYNLGYADVTVSGHDEPIGDDAFRVDALPVLTIPAGGEVTLDVTFLPTTEADSLARLRFQPGNEVVTLTGSGHAPIATVQDVAIPATVLGCSGVATVSVVNEGSEALTLSPTVTGEDFALTGWPPDVAPGETATIELAFTPGGGGPRGGFLTLSTNDPAAPQLAVELSGLGYEGERVSQSFRYAPADTTDIVLAVEGGLFSADARLDEAVETYAARLQEAWNDVHITSVASGDACPTGSPAWTEPSDSLLRMVHTVREGFELPGGAWDNDLVGLLGVALWEMEPGGCLDGFRRSGANLDVVLVAASPPETDAITAWTALGLPDGTPVRVSALVPRSAECGDTATTYADLAAANGGAIGDLCAADWTPAFEAFAALPTTNAEVRYPLDELPVASSITVTVDSVAFAGWSYDAEANAVVIAGESRPDLGTAIVVEYVSAVSCAP
ncbi:hypothetical protein LBMAG42_13340 [Deltaproteobacteria bacterium]|nr:hypothetical protein LBMAG42_13340 [Deltaproteobacteria bacterium]